MTEINGLIHAILAAGLQPPELHQLEQAINKEKPVKWSTSGKKSDRAGFCFVRQVDEVLVASFGCMRSGLRENWSSKTRNDMSEVDWRNHIKRIEELSKQLQEDANFKASEAAIRAQTRWENARPADDSHPYLLAKNVSCHGLRVEGENLLIPCYRFGDEPGSHTISTLQTISPSGEKLFMPGGAKKGGFYEITNKTAPKDRLILCEGFATGASIFAATGISTAVCFDAGNLLSVASAIRAKFADLKIIIAADDDHLTNGNPGLAKAKVAALAVGGLLAAPSFPAGRPDKATDFNDLHQIAGVDAVKRCIDSAAVSDTADDWPELQPLVAQIDAQDYPIDSLPEAVRCAVLEVAGFVKAPVPLIATSAIAALSLAIQAHTDVQRADKLHGPCGLFMLAIADSGERKSTCDGFFTKAIRDYEAREQEAAKPLIPAHKSDHAAWEAQRSGLKEKIKALAKEGKPSEAKARELHDLDQDEPRSPRVPRLIYGDATPEALTYALAKQWPSGGVISSEAGSVFGGHGMGADSVMRNLAALNQLWDGATLPVERRSSESFTVRGARLTMALQVQEATIRAFFANTKGLARGTGFLARFLVSWPVSTQGTRNFTEAPANWPALATFNDRLTAILNRQAPIDDDGALTPATLTLSPDAKAAWVSFHDEIESMLPTGGELHDVRDVASKTADNAARLAALFHTFTGSVGPIDLDAMESAASVTAWHLSEARRFLSELAMPAELANPARLEKWLIEYCKREDTDKVSTRELQQRGPGGLRDKATYTAAVKELAELGRARLVQDGKKRLIQIRRELLA